MKDKVKGQEFVFIDSCPPISYFRTLTISYVRVHIESNVNISTEMLSRFLQISLIRVFIR